MHNKITGAIRTSECRILWLRLVHSTCSVCLGASLKINKQKFTQTYYTWIVTRNTKLTSNIGVGFGRIEQVTRACAPACDRQYTKRAMSNVDVGLPNNARGPTKPYISQWRMKRRCSAIRSDRCDARRETTCGVGFGVWAGFLNVLGVVYLFEFSNSIWRGKASLTVQAWKRERYVLCV